MRVKEFQDFLREEKISCAILFNFDDNLNPNFDYFAGFEGNGCFIIPKKGRPVLLVPQMEEEKARKTRNKVIIYKKDFWKKAKKHIKGRRIGIDFYTVTLMMQRSLKKNLGKRRLVSISERCSELRAIKTKKELSNLKEACRITDEIMGKCFGGFRRHRFRTEKDVVDFFDEETRKKGCEFSFSPVVASGHGSSQPHYVPKDVKLRKGFCVIDFGVKYKGYCADMTRTIYLGKPKKKETDMYNLLLKVQEDLIKELKAGQRCSETYNNCVKKLGKYGKNFIHGLGHGVGLEIHELPNLRPSSNETIEEDIVFTIEPGIYFRGRFGIRIEDTILMGKKPIILTKTPKDLLRMRDK
ncbi:hypothetical protein COV19_04560 [Candidatus Woesearchaeota archaeon CG10_big_fil_rev_8_21_14_0_10_44_13]|nr:MAG: hypothetical protein COV19_04560 [Candidatus Woesearchaeota archaeon CG10_big_fil_rev_8_21_14_0_10_44_13]